MSSSRSAGVGSGSVGRLSFRRSPASAEAIGQGAGGSCRWRWWRGTERQRGRGSREAEQGNPPRCSFATLLVRHAACSPRLFLFHLFFPASPFSFRHLTLRLSSRSRRVNVKVNTFLRLTTVAVGSLLVPCSCSVVSPCVRPVSCREANCCLND